MTATILKFPTKRKTHYYPVGAVMLAKDKTILRVIGWHRKDMGDKDPWYFVQAEGGDRTLLTESQMDAFIVPTNSEGGVA